MALVDVTVFHFLLFQENYHWGVNYESFRENIGGWRSSFINL